LLQRWRQHRRYLYRRRFDSLSTTTTSHAVVREKAPHGDGLPNDTKMTANDDQDIRRSLARAFDRAWGRYYRSGRLTVGQDLARTELARRLVQLSKEGIRDEGRLAEAGLSHLRQLPLKGGETEP
jgi:hypothetical protein